MIQKIKKHSITIGLVFAVAAAVLTVGMTWLAYIDTSTSIE